MKITIHSERTVPSVERFKNYKPSLTAEMELATIDESVIVEFQKQLDSIVAEAESRFRMIEAKQLKSGQIKIDNGGY